MNSLFFYNYKFPESFANLTEICVFLGHLSSADWNARRRGGSMATAGIDAAVPIHKTPSSGITLRGRVGQVLENRDLCRMVATYIPNEHDDEELER